MSSYLSDDSTAGQAMHIVCDGCQAEIVFPTSRANMDAQATPDELVGWRRGIGLRDLCSDCQATLEDEPPRP